MSHDWHLFDAEAGYEVRRLDSGDYEVRPVDDPHTKSALVTLTAAEFERWRTECENPLSERPHDPDPGADCTPPEKRDEERKAALEDAGADDGD